jgi:ornithine carbamoyltransferase
VKQRHLVNERDWSRADIEEVFALARRMKDDPGAHRRALEGQALAMIFQKPSTRTRVSFEVGMAQLGGTALFLGASDIQLGRGETVADTARVLSRYVDGIMARVFAQEDLVELAKHATVPVINGLSDLLHPCQALADYFTVLERRGKLAGLKLAYVGDGNNMCHSLLLVGAKLGVAVSVAAPPGYQPNPLIVKSAAREAQRVKGPEPVVVADPREAVRQADVVYTDVWTSMGQEGEAVVRRDVFLPYQVNAALMGKASPDAVFMHCLPAHRGDEVTDEVMDSAASVVFDQSENRLHMQKAILLMLVAPR